MPKARKSAGRARVVSAAGGRESPRRQKADVPRDGKDGAASKRAGFGASFRGARFKFKAPVRTVPRSRGRVGPEGAEFPVPSPAAAMPSDYGAVLAELKRRIASAQLGAARSVNRELIALYWHVGAKIAERTATSDWGDAVVERLAYDVKRAFPDLEGFSPRNLWRMRAFYRAWSNPGRKLTQPVSERPPRRPARKLTQPVSEAVPVGLPAFAAELPWGHHIVLLQQLDDVATRRWYAEQCSALGWSRAALQDQIAKRTHARRGKAATNFKRTLPPEQAALARETLKDPYAFDFLTVGGDAHERVTERDLLAHVREFLLELGSGFAFIGNQVRLTVGGKDYYVDLLFFHVRLRCYVVVELKARAFKPEHVGKLNFYLSAVDDLLRHEDDQPTIGLILCKSKDNVEVEYALRDIRKPVGVADWGTNLVKKLPKELKGSLPSVEEIEAELAPKRRKR